MSNCPCCSGNLLRHVCKSKVYWYCPDCRQEMPSLGECVYLAHQRQQPVIPRSRPAFEKS